MTVLPAALARGSATAFSRAKVAALLAAFLTAAATPPPSGEPAAHRAGDPGVTPPRRTVAPTIDYPPAASGSGARGRVVLDVLVEADGSVSETVLIRAPYRGEALARAADAAVRGWRYEPATIDGSAVRCWVVESVDFHPPAGSGKEAGGEKTSHATAPSAPTAEPAPSPVGTPGPPSSAGAGEGATPTSAAAADGPAAAVAAEESSPSAAPLPAEAAEVGAPAARIPGAGEPAPAPAPPASPVPSTAPEQRAPAVEAAPPVPAASPAGGTGAAAPPAPIIDLPRGGPGSLRLGADPRDAVVELGEPERVAEPGGPLVLRWRTLGIEAEVPGEGGGFRRLRYLFAAGRDGFQAAAFGLRSGLAGGSSCLGIPAAVGRPDERGEQAGGEQTLVYRRRASTITFMCAGGRLVELRIEAGPE